MERQFSVSGRIAIWQRNRLNPKRISDAMIYKSALTQSRKYIQSAAIDNDEVDDLPVVDKTGMISDEWVGNWWLEKLDKIPLQSEILELFGQEEEEEDIYGI